MRAYLLFLLIFSVVLSGRLLAADENLYVDLIGKYSKAIASQDDGAILYAWVQLNKVPEAQAYMEKNFPSVAYSFRKVSMAVKLSDALKKFLESYPNGLGLQQTYSAQTFLKGKKQTNADSALNQSQPSNQEQVERERKAGLISNQATAANSLNQNQRSNSDQINDEVNRMRLGN